MREKYESLSLATLKELAKARGLKGISTLRKPELIEHMLREDEAEKANGQKEEKKFQERKSERQEERPMEQPIERTAERVQERTIERTTETAQLDSGEKADGILEVLPDGYGFIRCENYMPGENDILSLIHI